MTETTNLSGKRLNIDADINDGIVVAQVDGRVDTTTSVEFEAGIQALFAPEHRQVVLDFRGVDYVSSAGLRAVLLLARAAEEANCKMKIAGMNSDVRSIFEVTGFQKVVPVFDDVATALNAGS